MLILTTPAVSDDSMRAFFLAAFGGVFQEVLYWFDLRGSLTRKKYRELVKSAAYWLITVATVICSGIATTIWWYGESHTPKDYLFMGVAIPLIFKKAVEAFGKKLVLGTDTVSNTNPIERFNREARSYFKINVDPD
jgi:ABC-type spermidine/putrescine transport system permease subunit I